MSPDMHTIRFMLDEVKELVASRNYKEARIMLEEMNRFFQEAELENISLEIAHDCLSEAEALLKQGYLTRLMAGFWNRLFRVH